MVTTAARDHVSSDIGISVGWRYANLIGFAWLRASLVSDRVADINKTSAEASFDTGILLLVTLNVGPLLLHMSKTNSPIAAMHRFWMALQARRILPCRRGPDHQ